MGWLEIRIAKPFDGSTVVVICAPSELSVSNSFRGDPSSAAYANHLDWLVENVTTAAGDAAFCATRLVTKQLQHSRQGNPAFNPY